MARPAAPSVVSERLKKLLNVGPDGSVPGLIYNPIKAAQFKGMDLNTWYRILADERCAKRIQSVYNYLVARQNDSSWVAVFKALLEFYASVKKMDATFDPLSRTQHAYLYEECLAARESYCPTRFKQFCEWIDSLYEEV